MSSISSPIWSLIVFAGLFTILQIWWISSLMVKNRRARGERPLTSSQFRQSLERIFKDNS